MSPLSIWTQFFSVESARLPSDPVELAIICCTTVYRSISHIGIEIENCVFNSDALQEIRRRAPVGKPLKVQVKYNTELMSAIWVMDPASGARIEVVNPDPQTQNLSAYQVSLGVKLAREVRSDQQIIAFGEALKKMRATARTDLHAKTQTKRRNARRVLGIEVAPIRSTLPNENKALHQTSVAPIPNAKSGRSENTNKKSRKQIDSPSPVRVPLPRYLVVKNALDTLKD